MAELMTEEERKALSTAVVNAVDPEGHKPGLCWHCGRIKMVATMLMNDRPMIRRLVALRRDRERLLASEECRA